MCVCVLADQVKCCTPLLHNLSGDMVCPRGRVRWVGVEGDLATAAEHTQRETGISAAVNDRGNTVQGSSVWWKNGRASKLHT